LEPHQQVMVELADGTMLNSVLLRSADDALHLLLPMVQRPARFEAGQPLHVTFWRPLDARYQFESRVIGTDARRLSLAVAHAPTDRIQQRKYPRVYCREVIQLGRLTREQFTNFAKLPQPPPLSLRGRLHDLSVGGACFTTPMALTKNGWVALSIGAHESQGPIVVPGQVLRQTRLGGTSKSPWRAAVEFAMPSQQVERQVKNLVAEIDSRHVIRMLLRSGNWSQQKRDLPSARPTRT
jgi:c-di-GMP-binding flagellar brake protein YcgR